MRLGRTRCSIIWKRFWSCAENEGCLSKSATLRKRWRYAERRRQHWTHAYCYVVADLTEALEIRLQNMGATKTPDNMGYYGFNPTLNAYYEVISYAKVLADAKKRNRVLFDKLGLP